MSGAAFRGWREEYNRTEFPAPKEDVCSWIVLQKLCFWSLQCFLAFSPYVRCFDRASVQAQSSEAYPFYIEPGVTTIRKPDGSAQMYGKVVIDMRNGDVWGFPTVSQTPYPLDPVQTKPPKSSPMYLGKFMFDQVKH